MLTLICYVPPSCPAAQPLKPISYQPKQNQADGGTAKIKVNPTQLSNQMPLPVKDIQPRIKPVGRARVHDAQEAFEASLVREVVLLAPSEVPPKRET